MLTGLGINSKKSKSYKDLVVVIGILTLILAIVDYKNLSDGGNINLELRTAIAMLMAFGAILVFEDGCFVKLVILFFPNSAFAGYLLLQRKLFDVFFFLTISQILIILCASIFQWRMNQSFLSEDSFRQLKRELADFKENSLAKILHFGLLGCLRDRDKIVEHAYHILETVFKADRSVIFMADYENNALVPMARKQDRYTSGIQPIMVDKMFWKRAFHDPERGMLSVIAGNSAMPSLRKLIPESDLDAMAAMPVSASDKVIGLVAVIKQKPENRHYLDPALFSAFGYVLGSSLENCSINEFRTKMLDSAEKASAEIRSAFGKYVSDAVVEDMLNNKGIGTLGGKKNSVSIMMADLRGFTSLSSVLPIEKLVHILNTWFDKATKVILKSNGTIDKYMGDCIMVIFGAPVQKPDDQLRAVYTAFRLMECFNQFNAILDLPAGNGLGLGISITSGEAIVGNFGSSKRMEYTAIGEVVNLASRLEKLAKSGDIVLDEATFSELPKERFSYEEETDVPVKGLANQKIYRMKKVLKT